MIFSASNREVEISKANDDSYFRKSDVVDFVESYISEIITESGVDKNLHTNTVLRSIVRGLENIPSYSPKNNDNSADLISRKEVDDYLCRMLSGYHYPEERQQLESFSEWLNELPTIPQTVCDNDCEHCSWVECPLPQKPIKHFGAIECPKCGQLIYDEETEYEWCKGCKEYDTEKHCCHRWSSFIRYTLNDKVDSVLEDIKAEIANLERFIAITKPLVYLDSVFEIIEKHISGKE